MVKMFGIPNCDTIKKAKKWLDSNEIDYEFHNYKKLGVSPDMLKQAIEATSLDEVVNKRGTTYRKLSEADQQQITQDDTNVDSVIALLCEHSSMIKRPILIRQHSGQHRSFIIGYSAENYQVFFNDA